MGRLHRGAYCRRRPAALVLFLVLGAMLIQLHSQAYASFSSAPSAPSMSISSATLAGPTSPGASNINCVVLSSTQVRVTWTATTSTFADGYEIFRSTTNGGPYSSKGTVSGRTTTTFTDTTVSFSTTYYYVIQSTKLNWRSVNSSQVSITTPTALCV